MKNPALKYLTPAIAGACLGLLPGTTQAQTTPVFDYTFPASWGGTGTTVIDQSSAGNNGIVYNYAGGGPGLQLSANVPTGAPAGSMSINGSYGGIVTSANGLLDNSIVAAAGGFTYNLEFYWPGATGTGFGTQKLIDYAGTESLQLTGYTQHTTASSATLESVYDASDTSGAVETVANSLTISANTWYDVTLTFNTTGNSVVGGQLSGISDMYVNGVLISSVEATKGSYGDSLDRPIGVANLGADFGSLVGFSGDIFSASVDLGVTPTPEPSTLALSALGGVSTFAMMLKGRRRKA